MLVDECPGGKEKKCIEVHGTENIRDKLVYFDALGNPL